MFHEFFGDLMGVGTQMPGGAFGFGRRTEHRRHLCKVSLEDFYNSKLVEFPISKSVICKKCKGNGCKKGAAKKCRGCDGRGLKVEERQLAPGMVQEIHRRCPDCDGEGEVIRDKDQCGECSGRRVKNQDKTLRFHVHKGMVDGQEIPFRGEGDQLPGLDTGDVIIILKMKEHETFSRDGDDLIIEHCLSVSEALCGYKFYVKHLDGRNLCMQSTPGEVIKPGTRKVVVGEGMPRFKKPSKKGNLFIDFKIVFPKDNFASEEKLRELEGILPLRPQEEIQTGEDVEEVNLVEYDGSRDLGNEASGGEDRDEGGKVPQCVTH